ncbi:MAG: SDR family oxidoreductase [Actinomycetota bacterium]
MALPVPSESSTAVVTGASAGIGEAIARELAARGQNLTLAARREERLTELAAELHDQHGVRVGIVACDLGEASARDRLAAQIADLGFEVEVLVNNAGFGYVGDFVDGDRGRQVEMVRLNCEAVVDLTARYLPAMVQRGRGNVINIASTGAFQPMPKSATYGATKAFVLSHSEAVHHELRGTGVTLTAVCPGPVRTEFVEAADIKGADSAPGFVWMSAEDIAKETVDAAEAGKRAIVPGMLNYAGMLLGRHSPRVLTLPFAERFWSQVE